MSLLQLFQVTLEKEGENFIVEVYRQLLQRKPEKQELQQIHFYTVDSKQSIIVTLMQSEEAINLYTRCSNSSLVFSDPTISTTLQMLIPLTNKQFIFKLYYELLHREPDPKGFKFWLHLLEKSHSKMDILLEIFLSQECQSLLWGNSEN